MSPAVRFVRQYLTASGNVFFAFETKDGQRVDVKVREGRGDTYRYTRREARVVAEDRLAGSPPVWYAVCPDWSHGPVTHDEAVQWAADVEALGAKSLMGCHHRHDIVRLDAAT